MGNALQEKEAGCGGCGRPKVLEPHFAIKMRDAVYNKLNITARSDFKNSYYAKFNKLYGISEEQFMEYYDESLYGGYPEAPKGSMWETEGKALYVLIRILKPQRILEIGNLYGASSNHILQAVEANGSGFVDLLDIEDELIREIMHNRNYARIVANSLIYLKRDDIDYDFIVQDSRPDFHHVKAELLALFEHNQASDYTIWAHNYFKPASPFYGVNTAYNLLQANFTQFEPMKDTASDAGFLIARRQHDVE